MRRNRVTLSSILNKHPSDKTSESRPDLQSLAESRSAAPTGPTALPPHRDSLKIKHIGDRDSGAQQQLESRSTDGSAYRDELKQTRDELKRVGTMLGNYDLELRRTKGELRQASQLIENLRHDNQRSTDKIRSLQNELYDVHQQLEDAKLLSEVRGKELVGFQVFLTKADTLSISEVGEKVTALNEEIFQAAAALAVALVHKPREVSQTDLDAAAAVSQEMVGEKMTKLLIDQSKSQKPEPEVNPLLVQVVLQILMVKFCVSKIQSWYPGDPAIGGFLSAIYSQIRSSGKASY